MLTSTLQHDYCFLAHYCALRTCTSTHAFNSVKTDAEFIEDSSTDAPVPADPTPLTSGPDLERLICNDSESEFASLYQR
jgi:hypothetical protein